MEPYLIHQYHMKVAANHEGAKNF
jgi:hypothetical protein